MDNRNMPARNTNHRSRRGSDSAGDLFRLAISVGFGLTDTPINRRHFVSAIRTIIGFNYEQGTAMKTIQATIDHFEEANCF